MGPSWLPPPSPLGGVDFLCGSWGLTVAVAARGLHQPVVLVIAHHGLVAVALAALLDVPLDLQAQRPLGPAPLRQDAIRPVAHGLGVVLVAGAVLGLRQWVQLVDLALLPLLALPCEQKESAPLLTSNIEESQECVIMSNIHGYIDEASDRGVIVGETKEAV